jgi:hypothetical protein
VTEKLRRSIASRLPEDQIREAALAGGMISLGEDGLSKVKSGVTTAEELLRVVTEVREVRRLCSGCGSAVGVDFVACPQCGKRLSGGCPHCGRALQPGWNFCPYCARSTEAKRAAKRLREGDSREALRELPPANVAEFKEVSETLLERASHHQGTRAPPGSYVVIRPWHSLKPSISGKRT